jgi:hypothetical protein
MGTATVYGVTEPSSNSWFGLLLLDCLQNG